MIRRPPRSTRTDTLLPYTTLFRSLQPLDLLHARGDVTVVLAFLDAIETLRPAMLEQHADRRRAFGQVVRQAPHPAEGRSEERRVGKECSVRVDLGGRRIIQIKNTHYSTYVHTWLSPY